MLKNRFFAVCAIIQTGLFAQDSHYYYKNEKMDFEFNYQLLTIWNYSVDTPKIKQELSNLYQIEKSYAIENSKNVLAASPASPKILYVTQFKADKAIDRNTALSLQKVLNELESTSYSSFAIKNDLKDDMYYSNQIYVMLRSKSDENALIRQLQNFNVKLLGTNEFMPLLYHIICDKNSNGSSNEIANSLNELEFIEFAEPEILNSLDFNCTNDQFFNAQWFLQNTGQDNGVAGVDIRACDAWQTTSGSPNIITAVIDEGFEMNHPDLQANVSTTGFDVFNGTSPSIVRGIHGTACAGIVAAVQNNTVGVSGVAPNSSVMSISVGGVVTAAMIANGINWAWQGGASVLSNSWSSNAAPSATIDVAFLNALNSGRNGLGSVVVFSSGNGNSAIGQYPANSNYRYLCVGAIDRCGIRSGRADIILNSCDPWSSTNSDPASLKFPPLPGQKI